jgi:hypothetical protein
MKKTAEEGEVVEELEIETRAKRRKTWQEVVECHEVGVKRHKVGVKLGGTVRIFLHGTSEDLLVYPGSPEPLLCHVLDELSILQRCQGGVIFQRGTKMSLRFERVLPIGEYDFVPASSSGYTDGNRLLHREAPNVSPNTFVAGNAFIYNDHLPIREEGQSVCVKRFHAELAVDSGCHMELVIPKRKARQLGLRECGQHIIQGYGGANTIMQIYRSVLVCLVKDGKTFKRADLIPASRLDEEDGLFAGLRDVKSIEDVEMLEFGEQPSEDLSLPLKVTQYSPVKNKARQMPDAILGLRGLEKMRFTIDFEKSLLIPMYTTGFVSTTVDSSIQSCGSGLSDV